MVETTFPERQEEWSNFLAALRDQSELGEVLIVAAFMDNQLRLILESFLVDGRVKKELMEGLTAPLGSFSARTNVAFAMGLITKQEYDTINAVRSVRNAFAHNITTSLMDEKVKAKLKPMLWAIDQEELGDYDPGQTFHLAAQITVMQLLNRADHARANRLNARDWPHERIDFDPDYDPY